MNRPARRASHKRSIVEIDDDDSDDSTFATSQRKKKVKGQKGNGQQVKDQQEKGQTAKMTQEQEGILIAMILERFDVIENRKTDKSLNQSNKKKATEAWNHIQAEFERKTNVSNAQIC